MTMMNHKMKNTLILVALLAPLSGMAAQTCNPAIPAVAPDSRYVIRGAEVIDTRTLLVWQRCSLGQSGADCSGGSATTYTWQEALQAAEDARSSTGVPWRLPNIKELETLVESKCYAPAINETVFPNTRIYRYWSASPMLFSTREDSAGVVRFSDGYAGDGSKKLGRFVRLVRDGQAQ